MCDFDPPSFTETYTRRARHEHRCEECRQPILKGERHRYIFGIWDGQASGVRFHEACLAMYHKYCFDQEVYVADDGRKVVDHHKCYDAFGSLAEWLWEGTRGRRIRHEQSAYDYIKRVRERWDRMFKTKKEVVTA